MILKYNLDISSDTIQKNLKRIVNQIYKLLPLREEEEDWKKPLNTLMEELAGMNNLLIGEQQLFFPLLCKMEGLFQLTQEEDFLLYRRTIFECLSLLDEIKQDVEQS